MESGSFRVEKEKIEDFIKKYKLAIPPFQRKLVWKTTKQSELIDSLIKKYPIGAITLYDNDTDYFLVDGLQRYNTINLYLKNPASVYSFKSFYSLIENDIIFYCNDRGYDLRKVKAAINNWYSNIETSENDSRYKFENFNLFAEILKSNKLDMIATDFDSCSILREIIMNKIDFRKDNIALIIYSGNIESLPEIFAKINQRNVSLSSYEILHSMWYKYIVSDSYKGINYKKKYMEMLEADKSYKTTSVEDFNVFMYLSAIGYLYTKDIETINENYFKNLEQNIFSSEIVFDAFSTIIRKTSNEINKAMIIAWGKGENYIFELGNKILAKFKLLNNFIVKNKLCCINSKYFYLFLFYIFYCFDSANEICVKTIESIADKKWFVGDNRQLSFFKSKIASIDEFGPNFTREKLMLLEEDIKSVENEE